MEIGIHELFDFFGLILNVATKGLVVESTELGYDAVDHGFAENALFLIDGTLTLQAIGRCGTTVRQLGQRGQAVGIGCIVDVYVDVGILGHFQGIIHLEPMTAGHTQACQQLIEIGAAIG